MSDHDRGCDVVISFDVDGEAVWVGEDPANSDRPGTLSQGTYGPKVAVPLLLDLLRRLELPATFFVPGRVAERYPQRVMVFVQFKGPPGCSFRYDCLAVEVPWGSGARIWGRLPPV